MGAVLALARLRLHDKNNNLTLCCMKVTEVILKKKTMKFLFLSDVSKKTPQNSQTEPPSGEKRR